VQIAEGQIGAARGEVEQLQQRLSQLRAAADDAERDAAATRELLVVARAKNEELSAVQAGAAERERRLAETGDALGRHRARALAALQQAAVVERELAHMAQVLDETRAGADRMIAKLTAERAEERARAEAGAAAAAAELVQAQADLATVTESLRTSGERAQAREAELRLALDDAAAREHALNEQAEGLGKELAEFQVRQQSLRLALDDAVVRETGLMERERELRQGAESLQAQLGDLEAAHRAVSEALDDVSDAEVRAREAGELIARVLENAARHAAEVGGFAGEPLDAFEAIDRLQTLLAEARDAQTMLEARLAAQAAARARQLGPRLRRMMGALVPGAKPARTRTLAVVSRADEEKV
jgi:chromosome segregation ATPase